MDRVVPEQGFSDGFFASLKEEIAAFFAEKAKVPADELIEERYRRFRKF